MFSLTEDMGYYIFNEYVDMRCGVYRLYEIVCNKMPDIPIVTESNVFIFFGKNRKIVKILRWDRDGLLLYQKRIDRGTFEIPFFDNGNIKLDYNTFEFIIRGIRLDSVKFRKRL